MSRIVSRRVRTFLTTALVMCFIHVPEAQLKTVSLAGVIRDESGAVLAGVEVTATRDGVSGARAVITKTDERGVFEFNDLPPGTYTVDITAPGFERMIRKGVRVTGAQAVRLDIQLSMFIATAPPPPPEPPPGKSAPPPAPAPSPRPTPPPSPTPTTPGNAFETLRTFIDQMQSAAGLLKAEPSRIELGERVNVTLTISPSTSTTELLQRLQTGSAAVDAREAKIAPRMRAQLIVPGGTAVAAVGSEERAVHDVEDTIWQWTVTPVEEGELPISARLTAPLMIDGKETPYDVRTFEATVLVNVTAAMRIRGFVANNWQWLWTTIVIPVFIWWRKRSSTTRKSA